MEQGHYPRYCLVVVGGISQLLCLGCPYSWSSLQGKCYRLFTDQADQHSADVECAALGGNLASVTSHGERELLGELAGDSLAWIGASDGRWFDKSYWDDSSTFFDSSDEIILDKALSGNSILMKGPDYGWSKSDSSNSHPFLCQTTSE